MKEINFVERYLFLEGIFIRYGYDFRQYAQASLDRRLQSLLNKEKSDHLLDLLKKIIDSPSYFREILPILTINTTEFFRDPLLFLSLRKNVFPILKTYPRIVIWVAGCSTGEEVLSLAITLSEENLLERTTIYATDIDEKVLKTAKSGIYETSSLSDLNNNYVKSGGQKSPSEYYTSEYGLARFDPSLLKNVVFSEHNLVTDDSFMGCHLILCRNVLIYFNRELQNQTFMLFAKSLTFKGFLAIGPKESLNFSANGNFFEPVDSSQNVFALKTKVVAGKEPESI